MNTILPGMTREQKLAHFAKLRERNKKPEPFDPLAEHKNRIKLQTLIQQETYQMKTKISGKKDFADNATASVSAAKQMDAIRLKYKADEAAVLAKYKPTLELLDPGDLKTKNKIDGIIKGELDKLRADTAEKRTAIISDLKLAKTLSDEFGPTLGDARSVASMWGLNTSEARARANVQLASAGPAVLRTASVQAKMLMADPATVEAGKALAAEVLARNSALDKAYRIFKPEEASAYAAEAFATEVSDISNYSTGIARSLATALACDRDISGEGTSPVERMKLGLKFPGERIVPNADAGEEASNPGVTGLDKIQAGLAALNG